MGVLAVGQGRHGQGSREWMMGITSSRHALKPEFEELTATKPEKASPKRGRWSTAFLVAGSAMLGATAVALWNRRTIANMRVRVLAEPADAKPGTRTDEEIF